MIYLFRTIGSNSMFIHLTINKMKKLFKVSLYPPMKASVFIDICINRNNVMYTSVTHSHD